MGFKNQKRRLISLLALFFWALTTLSAQQQTEQADSLVRLISAKYVNQTEVNGDVIRKAVDAVFLHNGTYLTCDSSVWSANNQIINFLGNVKLVQGDTELTSEKLDYLIEENLAQFRGVLVELRNKQNNILRTKILDYNTKDSVAVFSGGASMKSEDGQIIESDKGSYFNAVNLFKFNDNVNMFVDSVFVKTDSLDYDSDKEKAYFTSAIDFWKDDNILTADAGWYEKAQETFYFNDNVHAVSADQESWSDTLYFYRNFNDVLMLGNVQLQDTTRSVASVSDYFYYKDAVSEITLKEKAAVAMWTESQGQIDTTYLGADMFRLHTIKKCDIDSLEIANAKTRLEFINADPVSEYRKRAAQEYERNRAQMEEEMGLSSGLSAQSGRSAVINGPKQEEEQEQPEQPQQSELLEQEQEPEEMQSQELELQELALPEEAPQQIADTTEIAFMLGLGNVKVFREDIQLRCDSLVFNELDSIARLHINPIVWNEGRRQYTSDSLFVLVNQDGPEKASLMSNAFIAVQEDSVLYDQIMSTEVMAYFNKDAELTRFDALGGASALFYIEENDELVTANKVETKLMSATLKDGEVETVYYFDAPKNDVYPVAQLSEQERIFKGFNWQPELKPQSPEDISELKLRPSGRRELESHPRPAFTQTDRFFPGWMQEVYKSIEEARERKRRAQEAEQAREDSLELQSSVRLDTLQLRDTIAFVDSLVARDSVARKDSLGVAQVQEEEWMSESELRKAMRIARRDARWAELDARDAKKAELKQKRKEEKLRKQQERAARRKARQEARHQALLQKYIEHFEKQKAKDERKQKPDPARERSSGVEAGGELPASTQLEGEAS